MGEYDQQRRRWPFEDGGGLSRAGGQLPSEARKLDLPSWYRNPRGWDYVEIIKSPYQPQKFFCKPIKAKGTHRLDVKEGKGQDGATLNHQGLRPSPVLLTLLIWTGADERRWNDFYPAINPKMNPKGRILCSLNYPSLARGLVRDVYVWDISEELRGDGILVIEIQSLEYLAPKPVSTSKQKKQGEVSIARPNAFDVGIDTNDVRTAVTDPAKDVKIK